MKQLDLIIAISALVIGIVVSWILWSTKKQPDQVPQTKTINLSTPELPKVNVAQTSGLPGGAGGGGGGGGRGRGKAGGFLG